MAVKSSQQVMGSGQWRTVLQRGFDTANELSDVVADKISAVTDPRARLLRRRRRALRWAVIFGVASAFWATVTILLAAWGWFVALLVVTGSVAAGSAIPATLLLLRYRWLRSLPLPTQRAANARRLPPPGSAARPAMHAIGASERGFSDRK